MVIVPLVNNDLGDNMIYERQAFIAKNSDTTKDILLAPERYAEFGMPCKCQFFVNISLPWDEENFKKRFWLWVKAHMEGEVRVFGDGTWIGFTNYNDSFEFLLSW
jgi:hypothetical protein